MTEEGELKNVELDKICRVCLRVACDTRPLWAPDFLIPDMLKEIANVSIENIDGWPDKICIQCIHQISRCHAFKTKVEKADSQLRQYIKGLTVVVEHVPKTIPINQMEIPRDKLHQLNRLQIQNAQTIEIHAPEITNTATLQQPIFIQTANQVFDGSSTAHQFIHAEEASNRMLSQIIQGRAGSLQMSSHVLQIQSADSNKPCEIILQQPDIVSLLVQPNNEETLDNAIENEGANDLGSSEDQTKDLSQLTDNSELSDEESESEIDEKQYLAEFMTNQTTTKVNGTHVCNLCLREFKHVKWLQSHIKSHTNWIKANFRKLPECGICGKIFKGPGMLKMHMKIHESKVNRCTICDRDFKSKSILYRHRQTHYEKNYQCQICMKAFSTNYQLNNHQLRHSQKSFKCSYCDKAYYVASDLKSHLNSHLGIKMSKKASG